jgi:UDP-N-acetylglucosamine:LPS N-acetylglucosamine transferase
MKIMLVTSSGGHLAQLVTLRSWWEGYERLWVTFDTPDAVSLLKDERVVWANHPTNRNIPNLIRNFFLAIAELRRERPDLIVSTGAGVALPFFLLGKFFGAKLVYIEVFDRVTTPTLTGRLVEPFVDKFLVQWPEQQEIYRKAEYWGATLR